MNNVPSNNLSRKVAKRDVMTAFIGLILIIVPAIIRDIYPNSFIIQKLFGGFKLLIYWILVGYIGWRFEKRINKNEKSK
ncbi:MAG: hypothetical protein C4526_03585 [Nitrospiraceae bacterium]|nr:MAG: hypothetical protein C4526_03585 [Nitrospiraceae bacterium]